MPTLDEIFRARQAAAGVLNPQMPLNTPQMPSIPPLMPMPTQMPSIQQPGPMPLEPSFDPITGRPRDPGLQTDFTGGASEFGRNASDLWNSLSGFNLGPDDVASPGTPFNSDLRALDESARGSVERFRSDVSGMLDTGAEYFTGSRPLGTTSQWASTSNPDQGATSQESMRQLIDALSDANRGPGGGGRRGFSGGVTTRDWGAAPPDLGPAPQRKVAEAVDYTGMWNALEQARPQYRAPNKLGNFLAGASQALPRMREDPSTGEALLAIGQTLAGGAGYANQVEEAAQEDFDRQTQGYAARRAELELSQADVEARHQQTVNDAELENQVAQRQDVLAKWERSQPQVLSADGGVLVYTMTSEDGKRQTMYTDTRGAADLLEMKALAYQTTGRKPKPNLLGAEPGNVAEEIASDLILSMQEDAFLEHIGVDPAEFEQQIMDNFNPASYGTGDNIEKIKLKARLARLSALILQSSPQQLAPFVNLGQ